MQKGITFLSIGEICYCALGRGDAERSEYSPFLRVPSLANAAHRVAIKAAALRLMVPGSRCDTQWHPRKRPTVGAGSSRFSRRFPRPPRPVLAPDAPTVPTTHAIHQWNPTVFVVGISVVLVCTWWQWEAGDGESHKDLGGGGAVGAARELPAHCPPFPCGLC